MSEGGLDHANGGVLQPITNEGRLETAEHIVDALHVQHLKKDISQPATKDEAHIVDGGHGSSAHFDTERNASTLDPSVPPKLHEVKEDVPENVVDAVDALAVPSLAEPKQQSSVVNGLQLLETAAIQQGKHDSDVPVAIDLSTISGAGKLDASLAREAQPTIFDDVTRVVPEVLAHGVEPPSIGHTEEPFSQHSEHVARPSLSTEISIPEAAAPESLSDIKLAVPLAASDMASPVLIEERDAQAIVQISIDKAHATVPAEIAEGAIPLHLEQPPSALAVKSVPESLEATAQNVIIPVELEQNRESAQDIDAVHVDVTKEAVPEIAKELGIVKMGDSVAPQENAVESKEEPEVPIPGTAAPSLISSSVIHDEHLVENVILMPEPESQLTNKEIPGTGPCPPLDESHSVETTAPAIEHLVEPEFNSTVKPQAEAPPPEVEASIEAISFVENTGSEACLVSEVPTTVAESTEILPGADQNSGPLVDAGLLETPIVEVTKVVDAPAVTESQQVEDIVDLAAAVEAAAITVDQILEHAADAVKTAVPVETLIDEPATMAVEALTMDGQHGMEEVATVNTITVIEAVTVIPEQVSEPPANAMESTIPAETPAAQPVTTIVEASVSTETQQVDVVEVPATAVETVSDQVSEPPVIVVETTIPEETLIVESVVTVVEAPVVTESQQLEDVTDVPSVAVETTLDQISEPPFNAVETIIPEETPIAGPAMTVVDAPVVTGGQQMDVMKVPFAAVEAASDQIPEPPANAVETTIPEDTLIAEPVTTVVEASVLSEPSVNAGENTIPEETLVAEPVKTVIEASLPTETQQAEDVVEVPAAAAETALNQMSEPSNAVETIIPEETIIAEPATTVVDVPVVTEGQQWEDVKKVPFAADETASDQIPEPLANAVETTISEVTLIAEPATIVVETPVEDVVEVPAAAVETVSDQVSEFAVNATETTGPVETMIIEPATTMVEAPVVGEGQQLEGVIGVPSAAVETASDQIPEPLVNAVETTIPEEIPMAELTISESPANAAETIPVETLAAKPVTTVVEVPLATEVQQAAGEVAEAPNFTAVETAAVMPDQISELPVDAVETTVPVEAPVAEPTVVDVLIATETRRAVEETVLIPDGVSAAAEPSLTAEVVVQHTAPTIVQDILIGEDVLPAQVIPAQVVNELEVNPSGQVEPVKADGLTVEANALSGAETSDVAVQLTETAATAALGVETSTGKEETPHVVEENGCITEAPQIMTTTPEIRIPVPVEARLADTNLHDDVDEPTTYTEVEAPIANSLHTAEADTERPKSPWTPSYSVTTQGPDVPDVPGQDEITGLEPLSAPTNEKADFVETGKAVETDAHVTESGPSVVIQAHEGVEDRPVHIGPESEVPEEIPSASLIPSGAEVERPKSSWSPSYSVMVQGSVAVEDVLVAKNDMERAEELDDHLHPTQETSIVVSTSEEILAQSSDGTEGANVTQVDTSAVHPEDNAEEPEFIPQKDLLATAEAELERPRSPWTPSYSVMRQGSVDTELVAEEEIADLHQLTPLATVESEAANNSNYDGLKSAQSTTTATTTTLVEQCSPAEESGDTFHTEATAGEVDIARTLEAVQAQDSDHVETVSQINITDSAVHSEDSVKEPELVPQADSLAVTEVELERPKSPWTPSYSVTKQGSVCSDQLQEQITDMEHPVIAEPKMVNNADDSEPQPEVKTTDRPVVDEAAKLEQVPSAGETEGHVYTGDTTQGTDVTVSTFGAASPDVIHSDTSVVHSENDAKGSESAPTGSLAAAEVEQERPKSPWTPSYSVTIQVPVATESLLEETTTDAVRLSLSATDEPGVIENNPDDDLQPTQISTTDLPVEDDITESEQHPLVTNKAEELDGRPTAQKVDSVVPTLEAVQLQDSNDIKIGSQIDTIDSVVHSEENVKEPELVPQTDTNLLSTTEVELERPKSPWTPSYSVMRQGSVDTELVPEEEITEIAQLSLPTTNDAESQPSQIDTVRQESEKTDLLAPLEAEVERPKSPWTPSYSVTKQGSVIMDVPAENDIVEVDLPPPMIHMPEAVQVNDDLQPQIEVSSVEVSITDENSLHKDVTEANPIDSPSHQEAITHADLHTSHDISEGVGAAENTPSGQSTTPLTNEVHDDPAEFVHLNLQVHNEEASTTGTDLHKDEAPLNPELRSDILTFHEEGNEAPIVSLTPLDFETERPKSPWTPSYGVMTQGPDTVDKIANVKQSATTDEPLVVNSNDNLQSEMVKDLVEAKDDPPATSELELPHNDNNVENTLLDDLELDGPDRLLQTTQSHDRLDDGVALTGGGEPSAISSTKEEDAAGFIPRDFATEAPGICEPSPKPIEVQVTDHNEKSVTQIVKSVEEPSMVLEDDNHMTRSEVEVSPLSSQEEPDRPKSPWIASHSVTRQGSGFLDTGASNGEELDRPEQLAADPPLDKAPTRSDTSHSLDEGSDSKVFPSTDSATSRPTVSRLAPINEDKGSNASTLLNVSPTTRARQESTTSSRFFPGGWFSPKPEGRTSLDTAKGEIISPVNPSPVVPAAPPPSAVDREVQEEKEKRSFCIVM